MSWVSGWFMKNNELMQASYTTIAITSLLATIICYTLLWIMQKLQFFPANKFIRTLILTLIIVCIALIIINFTALKSEAFNILVSSILGSSITTWKQPISKTK
jgi:magnesium-transporting ATPase (P-type)